MKQIVEEYSQSNKVKELASLLRQPFCKVNIKTLSGSAFSFLIAAMRLHTPEVSYLIILPDKEQAAFFANDLEELFEENNKDYTQKNILFYPASAKKPYADNEGIQNANIILRLSTLNRLNNQENLIVVTYPEALCEKVTSKKLLKEDSITINVNQTLSIDNLINILDEYKFERVDFVTQSGQYAIRGGIIDIFSYSQQKPSRIELVGDNVESIRIFDIVSQISIKKIEKFVIVPDLQNKDNMQRSNENFLSYFNKDTIVWTKDSSITAEKIKEYYALAEKLYQESSSTIPKLPVQELFTLQEDIFKQLNKYTNIACGFSTELNKNNVSDNIQEFEYSTSLQPLFNKNIDLFANNLEQLTLDGYTNYFLVKDNKQQQRIEKIIEQYSSDNKIIKVDYLPFTISYGFIDNERKISFFTDHQLFNRYHKYIIQDASSENEKLTLEDLVSLKPGDFVVHIDYGIGMFSGLEKIDVAGKQQEAIRLIYKNNDVLYVSIHSLHKISRYSSKEGTQPQLTRLGSNTWQQLKQKTKKKVKDIAKELIQLYAQRKASKGFRYSADNYMQHELEASFMYEDTIDQYKATKQVKADMEKPYPMDRLICGDVGFGKTEIAIRAAFKAVCDSKQVAVLVPTTILAFQHYKTFSERLKDMPCRVDYINRFRTSKEKKNITQDLKDGKIDILIGTHKLAGKDIVFKDLGLLIIDEEQKFGVSIKEKIRQMKVNVDTLTLTATPIPRTLQFSLMGARDLSVINTPPSNRQPITTEVNTFDKGIIRDAILFELSRNGQVYFVNNRVQNIYEIAALIENLVPQAKICVAHGQMEGKQLENIMMSFINQEYDVLIATTIVENGLDIPNANTIIVNDAQNYGLSDLHQLRGRVGRSNKRAFCYLLIPSKEIMTEQAYKRLQAIEEFSSIGSGFAIAMRDLDIRGAGNILGAEQSGFISEIGYDMYNKILAEALQELNEQMGMSQDDIEQRNEAMGIKKECTIETDLQVLIPDYYITNIPERVKIYKALDSMSEENELNELADELIDRFGKIPQQTIDLFNIIRIRKQAAEIGVDKLQLKRSKMTLNFSSDKFDFKKDEFQKILLFVNQYPQHCQLKKDGKTLQVQISGIKTISQAQKVIKQLI